MSPGRLIGWGVALIVMAGAIMALCFAGALVVAALGGFGG